MRICVLGEFNVDLVEGMRVSSFYIAKEISKSHQVLSLDSRKVASRTFWRRLKDFNPQVIHYIHGSSLKSFILLKSVSLYCQKPKTVISMMHPHFSISKHLISFIKPDLTLVQSDEMEHTFKSLKCRTEFLPTCGVDVEKFNPRLRNIKEELREKYGIDKDKFIILHVGHAIKGRNVLPLNKLQEEDDCQVVIVIDEKFIKQNFQKKIFHQLREDGCIIWAKYFKHIEEIYALSDCYLFPVLPKKDMLGRNIASSIEMPLSVLEAMSCNLPVITTKFGALPRVFKEGNGLFFAEGEKEILNALEKIKDGMQLKTRDKVLPYSWENVVKRLEENYEHLCGLQIDNFKHGGVLI